MSDLRAPFPWYGGKSRAAPLIWRALGDVENYVEPFAGSLAVLLGRPTEPRVETVNDRDAYLSNFWRAVRHDPEAVAHHADWPVSEADLHARHLWLVQQDGFRERMLTEPDYYDAKIAGWWVWGLSCWIGAGWCDTERTRVSRQVPHLTGDQGVHQKRPIAAGDRTGNDIHRKIPRVDGCGDVAVCNVPTRQAPRMDGRGGAGVASPSTPDLVTWFAALQRRLRRTRVVCGDWSRVLTPTVLRSCGVTGVVLDPPYDLGLRAKVYTHDTHGLSDDVRSWAIEHGSDPALRIVLCGYDGEHPMPASWQCVPWKAVGGYGNQRRDGSNDNAKRERLWLSPHCLPLEARQGSLFGGAA